MLFICISVFHWLFIFLKARRVEDCDDNLSGGDRSNRCTTSSIWSIGHRINQEKCLLRNKLYTRRQMFCHICKYITSPVLLEIDQITFSLVYLFCINWISIYEEILFNFNETNIFMVWFFTTCIWIELSVVINYFLRGQLFFSTLTCTDQGVQTDRLHRSLLDESVRYWYGKVIKQNQIKELDVPTFPLHTYMAKVWNFELFASWKSYIIYYSLWCCRI